MALRPGYEGTRTVEEVAVDNPMASLNLDVEGRVRTAKTIVTVNVSESPIEHMFHRGEIDDRLRKAADMFRGWCELSISLGAGINYDSVVVDCSRSGKAFPERAVDAIRRLERVKKYLGAMDYDLLCQAVTIGHTITRIAETWYPKSGSIAIITEARRHIGRRIKDALGILAELIGLGDLRAKTRQKPRLYHAFEPVNVHKR